MRSMRWVAILVVLVLGTSACGRSDDDTPTAGQTSSTEESRPVGGDARSSDFGTLTDVCQDGTPSGSPAQGVTPTEIDISTFSDPGFAGRPGLNQELFDAAEVFSKWCNDRGGINGRKIVVHERDAALTNVVPQMTKACREDFMTVGGGAVFDQDGVKKRLECLMPDVAGYVVSPDARGADLTVQPIPNPVDSVGNGLYKYLQKKFPAARKAYGVITPDLPSTELAGNQNKEVVDALGWKKVYDDVYPSLGPTSWAPYAQALKSAGVKGLIWVGEPEFLAKLIQAMNDIDYSPDFISMNANNYDEGPDRQRRRRAQGQRLHEHSVRPVRGGEAGLGDEAVPRTRSPSTSRTARPGPPTARRRSRPGSCSRRRPRRAATTSRASASTTTPRRSRAGPVAACTRPRTSVPTPSGRASWC